MNKTDELQRKQNEDEARLEQEHRIPKEPPLSADTTPQGDGLAINMRVKHWYHGKGSVYDLGNRFVGVEFDSGTQRFLPRDAVSPVIERSGTG